ncbi:MAG: nicotinate-nucleotide--dimethylbenzimidazole phosphoribosyltransferase [Lachnospiraceae bacterium]|nr:nicotinate-nucleotide--dimethylbenzimidazole phosphoribosyltransferase [Lachnospiraceae bacterium]
MTQKSASEIEITMLTGRILPPDENAMELSRMHWDSLAKPIGSLGRLEWAVTQIAGIQRTPRICIDKKALVIMCADNGVVEEGITQSGQDVTAVVAENFPDGKSCVSLMCRKSGTDLFPVDIGMAADVPRIENRKTTYGTKNMARESAMTRRQAADAVLAGMQKVRELKAAGYQILATGEMGIGNTATSSAVAAVLLDLPVEKVTGRGSGLSSAGLKRKIRVIRQAIQVNRPDPGDPLDVLAKVGGLDIAGLAGVFLGGACCGLPVVIDGLISSAAALTAVRLAPACAPYMLASHVSKEPAAGMLLSALEKDAFLTCDMSLGEGSGAVALFPLLDLAAEVYGRMCCFEEAGITPYERFSP